MTFASEDIIGNGSTFNSVGKDELTRLGVFEPEVALVEKFEALVQPIDKQLAALYQGNASLKTTRDALLPRLISGKLAVDGLDIRFPPGMAPMGSRIPTPETAAAMAEAREMGSARFGNGRELVASLDQKIGKSKARAPNEPT